MPREGFPSVLAGGTAHAVPAMRITTLVVTLVMLVGTAARADKLRRTEHPLFPTHMPNYSSRRLQDLRARATSSRRRGPETPRGGQVHVHHQPDRTSRRPGERARGRPQPPDRHREARRHRRGGRSEPPGDRQVAVDGKENIEKTPMAQRSVADAGHLLRYRQGDRQARVHAGARAGREAPRGRRRPQAVGRRSHRLGRRRRRQPEARAGARRGGGQGPHDHARRRGSRAMAPGRSRRWRATTPRRGARRTAASSS